MRRAGRQAAQGWSRRLPTGTPKTDAGKHLVRKWFGWLFWVYIHFFFRLLFFLSFFLLGVQAEGESSPSFPQ